MQTTTWRSKSRLRLADSIQRLRRLRIESGYDVERRNRSIASAALHNSRQELLSSVPTTFAGLHALVVYVHSANSDLFPDSVHCFAIRDTKEKGGTERRIWRRGDLLE